MGFWIASEELLNQSRSLSTVPRISTEYLWKLEGCEVNTTRVSIQRERRGRGAGERP